MNNILILISLAASCTFARGAVLDFALSPPGSSPAGGLSTFNEVIPGLSSGSGDEIGSGIFFNTSTLALTLNVGYGSGSGFNDLTGPAFSWLLHGPAISTETAPAIFDLGSLHIFAADPFRGGVISGSVTLTAAQASDLLGGLDYLNIYTASNLGGEIRGQFVVVPEPSTTVLLLAGIAGAGAVFLRGRRSLSRVRSGFPPVDQG